MIEHIDSLNDSRLDVFMRLTEVQLRNKLEPEKGILLRNQTKLFPVRSMLDMSLFHF